MVWSYRRRREASCSRRSRGNRCSARPNPREHFIQLYTDDAFLARAVADFVGAGLAEGQAAVIMATPPHVDGLTEQLATRGLDVSAARARDQLIFVDAECCLARFMVGDIAGPCSILRRRDGRPRSRLGRRLPGDSPLRRDGESSLGSKSTRHRAARGTVE